MQRRASTLATLILPIAKALRLQGVEPMGLLERAGIDPAMVINADRRIPIEHMQHLWRLAEEATEDECVGLLASAQLQPASLQALGLAMLTSDTVYDALRRLERFSRVFSTGLNAKLEEREEFVDLHVFADEGDYPGELSWATHDFAIGVIIELCRLTLGEYVSPFKVQCLRPAPADPDRFMSLLGAQAEFDAGINLISFVRADIVDQLINANPELARVNDEQTETYLATFMDVSASREVVGKIVEHLPDGPPNQKDIAEAMNVSNRTLQRKLKDEGTSFLDLLQDTRLSLARKYLAQPQRSIVEIAYLLGFSEPSTFSRAFKRWTGQAPADYRAELQQAA